jgi:hypothetical protein
MGKVEKEPTKALGDARPSKLPLIEFAPLRANARASGAKRQLERFRKRRRLARSTKHEAPRHECLVEISLLVHDYGKSMAKRRSKRAAAERD